MAYIPTKEELISLKFKHNEDDYMYYHRLSWKLTLMYDDMHDDMHLVSHPAHVERQFIEVDIESKQDIENLIRMFTIYK